MPDPDSLPAEVEIALLKEQVARLQAEQAEQDKFRQELRDSDAQQWRQLRLQRKIQAGCVVAFAIAVCMGFAGFSSESKDRLEQIVIGIIAAASAGFVGATYVDGKEK